MTHGNTRTARNTRKPRERWVLTRLFIIVALVVSVAAPALSPSEAVAAQTDDLLTASLIPDSTAIFAEVNLDRDGDQWQLAETLLARAGFPSAFDDIEQNLAQQFGVDIETDNPFLGGAIAFAIDTAAVERLLATSNTVPVAAPAIATPMPGIAAGVAAVLVPGDLDRAWQSVEDSLRDQAMMNGAALSDTDYRGATIVSVEATGSATMTAAARLNDAIILAATPGEIEPFVDTARGDQPAIAELPELAEMRSLLASETLAFSFLNGGQLISTLGPEYEEAARILNPQLVGSLPVEGYTGIALWADEPGLRLDSIAKVNPGSTPLPIAPDVGVTFDQRVRADALMFIGGSAFELSGIAGGVALSIAQLLSANFGSLATPGASPVDFQTQFTPEYLEEQFAMAEQILGFDLRADLFDQLEGEFAFAVSLGTSLVGFPNVGGPAVAEVRDQDRVAESLQRLARQIDQSTEEADVATRQINGEVVYTIGPAADEVALPVELSLVPLPEFGVVDGHLLAGLGRGINDFVNGPSQSLADDDRYQRVLATLPADYSQVMYVNVGQIVDFINQVQAETGDTSDAALACTAFESQQEAQAAYDQDPLANADLDRDFDGDACDDFFAVATPAATPVAVGSSDNIEAYAMVVYEQDGMVGSSSILSIADPS